MNVLIKEGFVPIHGYKIWYRIVGSQAEPGKFPHLLILDQFLSRIEAQI